MSQRSVAETQFFASALFI